MTLNITITSSEGPDGPHKWITPHQEYSDPQYINRTVQVAERQLFSMNNYRSRDVVSRQQVILTNLLLKGETESEP
jgi:hypothetical protein